MSAARCAADGRLRIGLDGKCLHDRTGGVSRYVDGLLSGLSALEDVPAVEVITPERPTLTVQWVLWHLQRETRAGWSVFHFPFYYPPLRPHCPVTVAIHDVLPIEHPEWFPRSWAVVTGTLIRRGARVAAGIVTPSEDSASRIEAVLGVPRSRIRVVPHGVDSHLFAPAPASEVAVARRRYRLDRPYVVLVGPFEARRGVELAITALHELRTRNRDLDLVLVGEVRMRFAALETRPSWVRMVGRVPDADLAGLCGGAMAFVAPSRGEGFDLPVLEALASGAAVVASDIPAHVELFGGAVATFASGDAAALAVALDVVIGDDAIRASLRARGLAHARRFDWATAGRAHVALWQEVARP